MPREKDSDDEELSLRRLSLFHPAWEGPIESWCKKRAGELLWRVLPLHDFDDLYQDGFTIFMRLVAKYPTVVDPPHFMRLFQVSFNNHVHTLSSRRSAEMRVRTSGHVDEDEASDLIEDQEDPTDFALLADWRLCLEEQTPIIRAMVAELATLDRVEGYTRRNRYYRETTQEFLQRVLGREIPPICVSRLQTVLA